MFEAASISKTSIEAEAAISVQEGQTLHGSVVTPLTQFRALANIRAVVVLPTPRAPVNK